MQNICSSSFCHLLCIVCAVVRYNIYIEKFFWVILSQKTFYKVCYNSLFISSGNKHSKSAFWRVNMIWILASGLILALESVILGCLLCVTVVGIPFGLQHFKLAKLALMPFGAMIR